MHIRVRGYLRHAQKWASCLSNWRTSTANISELPRTHTGNKMRSSVKILRLRSKQNRIDLKSSPAPYTVSP